MIALFLAGAGFWLLCGATLSFDGLIYVLAALLALCWFIVFLDARWHRKHRYDQIQHLGKTRL